MQIPPELGRLSLTCLTLTNNLLGETNNWQFLLGKQLRCTLLELDLSVNKITHFPAPIIKLEQIVTLKLHNNSIKRLPFGMRRLKNLRFLNLSSNQLESLPSIFNEARLELLDLWGNAFQPAIMHRLDVQQLQTLQNPTCLCLQAARVVHQHKIPYSPMSLPWILIDILSESPICACGKLCFYESILERATFPTFENVKNLVSSRDHSILADIVLCGPNCAGRKLMKEFQNPEI